MVSQMVPLGMTEFGAIVALGWRNEGPPAAELWVDLPSPMFGLASGWSSLGPLPNRGVDRVTGVVFSPSLRVNAHAGATDAIAGDNAPVATLVVGSEAPLAPARVFTEVMPTWNWTALAVSEDGATVGVVTEDPSGTEGRILSCWTFGEEAGVFGSPDSGPADVVALAVTRGLYAVGVAFDAASPANPQYAVLMRATETLRLDDIADGRFVFAAAIDRTRSILAARVREDGGMQLCRLVCDAVDPTVDGKTEDDDIAPFLENLVAADLKADVNLDGELDGVDLQMFWDALPTDNAPEVDWGTRALQLTLCAELFVDSNVWPTSIQLAAETGLRALLGVQVLAPTQLHTPDCVAAVMGQSPSCASDWDDACEAHAAAFYAASNGSHPTVSFGCEEIVCAIDSTCCDDWDSACAAMAITNCNTPGIGCAWTGQPWPYSPRFLSYCGANNGMTFPSPCFNECCFHHDACWGSCGRHQGPSQGLGGGVELNARISCDLRFKRCMHSKCLNGSGDPHYQPPGSECPTPVALCKFVANGYYHAVRRHGDEAWCACCASVDMQLCHLVPQTWPPPPPRPPALPPSRLPYFHY
jgi:hypothetical protein